MPESRHTTWCMIPERKRKGAPVCSTSIRYLIQLGALPRQWMFRHVSSVVLYAKYHGTAKNSIRAGSTTYSLDRIHSILWRKCLTAKLQATESISYAQMQWHHNPSSSQVYFRQPGTKNAPPRYVHVPARNNFWIDDFLALPASRNPINSLIEILVR